MLNVFCCFLCISKEGDVSSAASAAAVYHYYHPEDDVAIKNVALYRKKTELTEEEVEVQDTIKYIDFWKKGVAAYGRDDNEELVKYMEMSLESLLREIDRCRSLCKGPVKSLESSFFSEAVSQHAIAALKCRYNCPQTLGKFRDDLEEARDFLTLYFHYLAYGYLHGEQDSSISVLYEGVSRDIKWDGLQKNLVYYCNYKFAFSKLFF